MRPIEHWSVSGVSTCLNQLRAELPGFSDSVPVYSFNRVRAQEQFRAIVATLEQKNELPAQFDIVYDSESGVAILKVAL